MIGSDIECVVCGQEYDDPMGARECEQNHVDSTEREIEDGRDALRFMLADIRDAELRRAGRAS